MSKKRDPLAVVINYFITTEIAAVTETLSVVKEIVRSRTPLRAAPKKPAPARRPSSTGEAAGTLQELR